MPSNINHVLITGVSGAVGSALAIAYAKRGVQLSLLGRRENALDSVAKQCRDLGADVFTYSLDLRKTEELMKLIETIDAQKPIDLVIANAGVAVYLDDVLTIETWDDTQQTIDVNLTSAIATVTPLINRMRQRKNGQIAFISSLGAYYGLDICPSYCASKSGIKAYGEALRTLLKKDNIRVSVICPGFIDSDMSKRYLYKKHFMISAEKSALKIKKGLQHNKGNITFPYFLGLGMRLLSILPPFISEFFLKTCLGNRVSSF
jgi:short-subunit dehydrogenase